MSILAEIIQHRRSDKALEPSAPVTEATDPICGMVVDAVTARYRSEAHGHTVYFCCLACKETFEGG